MSPCPTCGDATAPKARAGDSMMHALGSISTATSKGGHGPREGVMHGAIGALPLVETRHCKACGRDRPIAEFAATALVQTAYVCKACRRILETDDWYAKVKVALCRSMRPPQGKSDIWLSLMEIAEGMLIAGRDPAAARVARVLHATRVALIGDGLSEPEAAKAEPPPPEDPRKTALRSLVGRYMDAVAQDAGGRKGASTTFWAQVKEHAGVPHKAAIDEITDAEALDRMLVKAQSLVFGVNG